MKYLSVYSLHAGKMFMIFCCQLILLIFQFFKKSFRSAYPSIKQSVYSLYPEQAQHSVGPDLGTNCLQTVDTNRLGVIKGLFAENYDFI